MTTDVPIPAAMVDAAKAEFLAITGMPSVEPNDTQYGTRILAAALAACEVHEQRRWVLKRGDARMGWSTWMPVAEADEWITTFSMAPGETATPERRLLIGTPPEPAPPAVVEPVNTEAIDDPAHLLDPPAVRVLEALDAAARLMSIPDALDALYDAIDAHTTAAQAKGSVYSHDDPPSWAALIKVVEAARDLCAAWVAAVYRNPPKPV